MRLWHQALLPYLDKQHLLGQHRECCALRGKGWGKRHSVVDYVFKHNPVCLYNYHCLVMTLLIENYDVKIDKVWFHPLYRGKNCAPHHPYYEYSFSNSSRHPYSFSIHNYVYEEHNDNYLRECLLNLKAKNAELVNGKTIDEILIDLDLKNIE